LFFFFFFLGERRERFAALGFRILKVKNQFVKGRVNVKRLQFGSRFHQSDKVEGREKGAQASNIRTRVLKQNQTWGEISI